VEVFTDPELLLRLIRNLLINAVRYTEAGEVSCTARSQGYLVEFEISDNGPGLSPARSS
jgi:signal transduction histidine kinase